MLLDKHGNVLGKGGRITYQYAKDKGFPVEKLRSKRQINHDVVRRAKRRIVHNIFFPYDMSVKDLKKEIKRNIKEGIFQIGEAVNPKTYFRLILEDGEVKQESFVVEGRKVSLVDIRRRILERLEPFMRLNNNDYFNNAELVSERLDKLGELDLQENETERAEKLKKLERTRNLIFWHDASVIINHGYLLFTVNVIYDPAVFYTDQE